MSDYSTLGSFATGAASSLNGDLIQKLYDAESKSKVEPLETSLELIDTESEKMTEINTKVNELIETLKPFDLYNSGANAFEQVTASTTGDSAVFDATDVSALKPGVTSVHIETLAQKDVFQSNTFSDPDADITSDSDGKMIINGHEYATTDVSYNELAETINNYGEVSASVEQVSDTEYRLIIKSLEPGEANKLLINEEVSDLGMDNDVDDDGITNDDDDDDADADGNDTVDNANHILKATNLEATIDGVDYNLSSNSITIDNNLKITATQTGDSAISVQIDDSYVVPAVEAYAAKYNELVDLVSEELYSDESSIQDKASLQSLLDGVKNTMYEQFGLEDNSLFNSGFSFDQYGVLTIDSAALGKSLMDNPDSMKDLFVGSAEDEGFGTKLKAQLDDLNSYNGLFASYTSSMDTRKTNLEDEKEKTIKDLDTKYDTMAAQFAAYGSMITQMESSFSGLKMIIDQDSAK